MSTSILSSLPLSRLQAHELSQLIARTLKDVDAEEFPLSDAMVTNYISQLRKTQSSFQKSLDQVKGSTVAQKIAQADRYRDHDLQALFDFIKPYKHSRQSGKKADYLSLAQLFKTFKEIKDANYEKESSQILNLLRQLEQTLYKENIALLNIAEGVKNLKQSQKEFEELFVQRTTDSRHKEVLGSKQLRQDLEKPYQSLCNYLFLMLDSDDKVSYGKVIKTINNSRDYYATTLAKRLSKAKVETSVA